MPPGTRNALVPPSPNYLANAGQFVGGVGRGLGKQFVTGPLELVQQSYQDPYALGQGVVMGLQELAQDPAGAVKNSLRSMWNRAKSSPAGLGEVVGENIDPRNWLKPRKALRKELDVYHGTPHTFPAEEGAPLGRFRSEKIGTGEGQQAYGYGLYLAEHPDVANRYKIGLTNPALHLTQEIEDVLPNELKGKAADWADEITAGKTFSDLLATVKYPWQKTLLRQQKEPLQKLISRQQTGGLLYKVDLPDAKIEQMLDWDQPVNSQSKIIAKLQAAAASSSPNAQAARQILSRYNQAVQSFGESRIKGENFYDSFVVDVAGGPENASQFLKSLGIPGIRYLDAKSRKAGQNTRNFVVFPGEEQHLKILGRD